MTNNQNLQSPSPSEFPQGNERSSLGRGHRIQYLDLARGFIVLVMPSVHVVMLYSHPAVQQSLLGYILKFLAEGPGAQLFMLLMGASLKFSKTITAQKVVHRTMLLLVGALALNTFKFCIPLKLGMLPHAFLEDFPLSGIRFLLLGDIFHFAAIAYPVTYFISRLNHYRLWAIGLAFTVMISAPYCWDIKTGNKIINLVLSYFTGGPPYVFFPVFPWLVYPLTGLAMARWLQSGKFITIGMAIISFSLVLPATTEFTSHYRTLPADTLFHTGIVLIWLALFHLLSKKIKSNIIFRILMFCSRNISSIYIIQWLLICWFFFIPGYLKLSLWPTLAWMMAITTTTLLLTHLLTKSKTHHS